MSFESDLTKKFKSMKCFEATDALVCLPVYDSKRQLIAFLKPITWHYVKTNPEIPELLTKWRIENPTLSTGKFTPTVERTKSWLDQHILSRNDRLLFMIEDLDHQFLGHIGFSNYRYADEIGEIDSVCRGIPSAIPGLMSFAMKSLMSWGYSYLKMKDIELSVYDDNTHAVHFYERFGFKTIVKKPLYKTVVNGEEKLEIAPEGYQGPVEKYYLVMKYEGENLL